MHTNKMQTFARRRPYLPERLNDYEDHVQRLPEAMEHKGELTCPSGKLFLGHLLIKNITGRGCT